MVSILAVITTKILITCVSAYKLLKWGGITLVMRDLHTGRVQLLYSETTLILAKCSCCTRRLLSYWPSAAAVLGDYSHTSRVQLLYSETTLILAECSCCTRRLLSYWPSAAAVLRDYSHTGRVQLLYSETTLILAECSCCTQRLLSWLSTYVLAVNH